MSVVALAFSPDSGTLAVAVDRTVQLWDVRSVHLVASLEGHEGTLRCLTFSPDGAALGRGPIPTTETMKTGRGHHRWTGSAAESGQGSLSSFRSYS